MASLDKKSLKKENLTERRERQSFFTGGIFPRGGVPNESHSLGFNKTLLNGNLEETGNEQVSTIPNLDV